MAGPINSLGNLVVGARVALSSPPPYAGRVGVVAFINTTSMPPMATVTLELITANDADAMVVVNTTHLTVLCHSERVPPPMPATPSTLFRPVTRKRDRDEDEDEELSRIYHHRTRCFSGQPDEDDFRLHSSSSSEHLGAGANALLQMAHPPPHNTPADVRSLGIPGVGSPPSLDCDDVNDGSVSEAATRSGDSGSGSD